MPGDRDIPGKIALSFCSHIVWVIAVVEKFNYGILFSMCVEFPMLLEISS